jgi:hypothetical protein
MLFARSESLVDVNEREYIVPKLWAGVTNDLSSEK